MKSGISVRFIRTFLILLIGVVSSAVDAAEIDRLRIDRWSAPEAQVELDEATMQQVAQLTGCGHFYVRSALIAESGVLAETARVFFIYSSLETLQTRSPARRILYRVTRGGAEVKTGNSEEIIAFLLSSASKEGAVSSSVVPRLMPAMLEAVLYEGRGRVWSGETIGSSTAELAQLNACPVEKREEMRATVRTPHVTVDATGRLSWHGWFVGNDGGMEAVTATFSGESNARLMLERVELRPPGYFVVGVPAMLPTEEWTVVKDSSWKAPQRYKMMIMLAALGSVEKQFQLGAALLQESDDAAKAEGIKWLEIAAARGNRDAAELLQGSRELLVRSDRDRDKVRVARCCPVPGR